MNQRETFRDNVRSTGFDGHPSGVMGGVFRNITSHIRIPGPGSHPRHFTSPVRYKHFYFILTNL